MNWHIRIREEFIRLRTGVVFIVVDPECRELQRTCSKRLPEEAAADARLMSWP